MQGNVHTDVKEAGEAGLVNLNCSSVARGEMRIINVKYLLGTSCVRLGREGNYRIDS
jgi:hypothetical protein